MPVDRCQLDVDHVDGDHANNDRDNLQTLCANCHRIKTRGPKAGELWSFEAFGRWTYLVRAVSEAGLVLEVVGSPDRFRENLYAIESMTPAVFFGYYGCRPETIAVRRRHADRSCA